MPSSSPAPLTDAELDRLYDQEPSDSKTARSIWFQKGIARMKQNPFVPIGELIPRSASSVWTTVELDLPSTLEPKS